MKILLAVHGFPPENVGGTELYVQRLARSLVARGHEVYIVAGTMRYEEEDPRAEPFEQDGLRGTFLLRADYYFDSWEKSYCARTAALFEEIVRREQPDLVHVHHWVRLSRNLVSRAARAGVPSVVTLHDLWSTCLICFRVKPDHSFCTAELLPRNCLDCVGTSPWMGKTERERAVNLLKQDVQNELRLAQRRIVPSQAHGDLIDSVVGEEGLTFTPIGHGLPKALEPQGSREGVPGRDRKLEVLCWSHLYPLKGQNVLLEAVSRMRSREQVHVHLLGDCWEDAYRTRLEELAEGLTVTFHGRFETSALPALRGDLAVLPTLCHESYSFVLDEAQALGLPTVCSRLGALVERAGRGGLFFERGHSAELAAILDRLIENPEELTQLRAELPQPLSFEQNVERVEALYREVLAERFDPSLDRFDADAHEAFEAYRSEQRYRWALRHGEIVQHAANLEKRIAELESPAPAREEGDACGS